MSKKFIAPSHDLMLPGIFAMPRTSGVRILPWEDNRHVDEPYLHREASVAETRDAIEKFNYPKLGTRVRIGKNYPRRYLDDKQVGSYAWIIGYTSGSFSSRDGEYTVHIAYDRVNFVDDVGNDVYDEDGVDASWLVLDDGSLVSDAVTFGPTKYKKCLHCKRDTEVGRMHMGKWCYRPRCTLVAMRESL